MDFRWVFWVTFDCRCVSYLLTVSKRFVSFYGITFAVVFVLVFYLIWVIFSTFCYICDNSVNPPRLIRFREYRRGFQTPHELSFMPATLGRSGYLTTDTAQTQWLCRAALPSAEASGFALDAQSTA